MGYLQRIYGFNNIVMSVALLLLSSLSVYAVAEQGLVSDADHANLVIQRLNDASAVNYRFSVDDQHIGKLKRGEVMYLQLSAGEHVIYASDPNNTSLTVQVAEHAVSTVEVSVNRKAKLSLQLAEQPDVVVSN